MLNDFLFLNTQGLLAVLLFIIVILIIFKLVKFMLSGFKGALFLLALASFLIHYAPTFN